MSALLHPPLFCPRAAIDYFLGSLKAGFVTERSELGSRSFYPVMLRDPTVGGIERDIALCATFVVFRSAVTE